MKPNFALSLSFDGIRVLHRAAGGWREVGEVALTTDDLAGELAVLRKTAASLGPSGVRTKLLIPNAQIKYLTIDTPGMPKWDRRAAVKSALDGATPYPVADLAFDFSIDGPRTHIAAVARETLQEAEDFATEHRFNPVSFVSVPGDEAYLGEPFFGMTKAAHSLLEEGDKVEPDGIAVVVVGPALPPTDKQPSQSETETETNDAEANSSSSVEAEEQTDTASDKSGDGASPAPANDTDGEDQKETVAATKIAAPSIPPPTGEPDEVPQTPAESSDAPSVPEAGFATRRSGGPERTPALSGVRREPSLTLTQVAPDSSSLDQPALEPAEEAFAPVRSTGFHSKRKAAPAAPAAPPSHVAEAPATEAERLTIFGARDAQVGGKPRYLGLILTVILLVFLAGVALWATAFLDNGLASLFGGREPRATASAPGNLENPQIIIEETEQTETAALDPSLSSEDSAVLDALAEPQEPPVFTPQEAAARYAVTGIWPLSPETVQESPQSVTFNDVYLPSVDAAGGSTDAIALPGLPGYETDEAMPTIASPPPAGTTYALDARGMLIPTPEGTLSSDGYVLFLASPPMKPPARPSAEGEAATPLEVAIVQLAGFRPRTRPEGFEEAVERAQTGGLIRAELAQYRPSLRPQSLQDAAAAARQVEDDAAQAAALAVQSASLALQNPPDVEETVQAAVAASRRPDARPKNFERIVRRTESRQENVQTASAAATVAPRTVAPNIPSSASVSRQATVPNAINLRKVNLIGVYGKPSNRRALVRLGNGRYQKVVVGDRIDGGRVSAISDTQLLYRKGSRDIVLSMPKG